MNYRKGLLSLVRKLYLARVSGGSRGGARGARVPLILGEKGTEMTEGRKAGWASKLKPGPLSLAQSLDPPLRVPFKVSWLASRRALG